MFFGGDGAGAGDAVMQFAMLNKISTGNSMIDVALCMLVPLLLRQLVPWLQDLWERLTTKPDNAPEKHERLVTYTQRRDMYSSYAADIDKEPPNHLLHAALLLYLNKLDLSTKLSQAEVQLRRVKKEPTQPRTPRGRWGGSGADGDGFGSDGASSAADSWTSWHRPSGDELLDHLGVALLPPNDTWLELEPGLKLKRVEEASGNTGGDANAGEGERKAAPAASGTTHTIVLRGVTAAKVDGFITAAWTNFREERRKKKKDESRYLYMPVLSGRGGGGGGEEGGGGGDRWAYKRYKLSEDKTFDSLFHPDKASVIELLDAFTHSRGKFSIKGYPQKLGFLMHGPPGTGKTSFIKALAQYTGRSIVSVPLARVRTNQELMDMLMDQVVNIEGQELPVALPFSKVVFIFEDIDACGDVVMKRVPKPAPGGPTATTTTTELTLTRGGGGAPDSATATVVRRHASLQQRASVKADAEGPAAASVGGGGGGADGGADADDGERAGRGAGGDGGDDTAPEQDVGCGASASAASAFGGAGAPAAAPMAEMAAAAAAALEGAGGGASTVHMRTRQASLSLPASTGADALASIEEGLEAAGGDDLHDPVSEARRLLMSEAAAAAACGGGGGNLGGGVAGPVGPGGAAANLLKKLGGDDALNLAGLLNVLDGVVDTPGRIVVMTSNHPDKLDPALIRPGRINKKIYMGHIAADEACQMVRHWFGPDALANSAVEARLRSLLVDGALSPAALEAMCAEHERAEDLLDALKRHPALAAAREAQRRRRQQQQQAQQQQAQHQQQRAGGAAEQ